MTDAPPAPASAAGGDVVARLWLATLQDVVGRAAHDVKNLLNGVAVNLEVVRSRSARAGAEAASVRPFAESAAAQFERLSEVTDALLALARPAREPVNVVESWNAVAALTVPAIARSGGGGGDGAWRARPPADGADAVASGPAEPVRLALAAAALAAGQCGGEGGGGVTCTVSRAAGAGAAELRVAVACASAQVAPTLRDGVAAAVAAAGIRVGREQNALILTIPAAAAPATPLMA